MVRCNRVPSDARWSRGPPDRSVRLKTKQFPARVSIRAVLFGASMYTDFTAIQRAFKISTLCQFMEATLQPCWEEGFPRHHVHRLPTPVVVEPKGQVGADHEPQMAVVLHLVRHTVLLPLLKDFMGMKEPSPPESLYLAMPIGTPLLPQRTRVLQEASGIFLDLAEDETTIVLVAISHRRLINKTMVIRHAPVALFSLEGKPIWIHPAGPNYGLIRSSFPEGQRQRLLGPRRALRHDLERFSEMDDATGLPAMYAYAKQCLKAAKEDCEGEDPIYAAVLDFQSQSLVRKSIATDAEEALKMATQQFLTGFESFFGMGGMFPKPGTLDLA